MSSRRKRPVEQEEALFDDLAVAASYAVPPPPVAVANKPEMGHDPDEIELSGDDSSGKEGAVESGAEKGPANEARPVKNDDDSTDSTSSQSSSEANESSGEEKEDDDESDVDLTEALDQMMKNSDLEEDDDESDEEDPNKHHSVLPPRTKNELDNDQNGIIAPPPPTAPSDGRVLAGYIQHVLSEDRLVVVRSHTGAPGQRQLVLQEGTWLVVEAPKAENDPSTEVVPLGSIQEVFGPCSQPMYSLRLARPAPAAATTKDDPSPEDAAEPKQENETTQVPTAMEAKMEPDAGTVTDRTTARSSKVNANEDGTGEEDTESVHSTKQDEPKKPSLSETSAALSESAESKVSVNEDGDTSCKEPSDEVEQVEEEITNTEPEEPESATEQPSTQSDGMDQAQAEKKPAKSDGSRGSGRRNQRKQQQVEDENDPWSSQGLYSRWVQSSSTPVPVYYIHGQAQPLVDTDAIRAQNDRGCDASNLYDEEVTEVNEMDFSDDEQERQARRRQKGNSSRRRSGGQQRSERAPGHGPNSFHRGQNRRWPPRQQYSQAPPGTGPAPSGFHDPRQQQQQHYNYQYPTAGPMQPFPGMAPGAYPGGVYNRYPQSNAFPPPSAGYPYYQQPPQQQYGFTASPYPGAGFPNPHAVPPPYGHAASSQPPPPPPPNDSQASDTVYYEYSD